jgi:uncharacterized protein RhaS with RHS repeats
MSSTKRWQAVTFTYTAAGQPLTVTTPAGTTTLTYDTGDVATRRPPDRAGRGPGANPSRPALSPTPQTTRRINRLRSAARH